MTIKVERNTSRAIWVVSTGGKTIKECISKAEAIEFAKQLQLAELQEDIDKRKKKDREDSDDSGAAPPFGKF